MFLRMVGEYGPRRPNKCSLILDIHLPVRTTTDPYNNASIHHICSLKNESVENDGVVFVKGANERNEFL